MVCVLPETPPVEGRVKVRGAGMGICSTWMPSHAVSMGSSVYVPLEFTRTLLQPCDQP
jgi:hypothetical protein